MMDRNNSGVYYVRQFNLSSTQDVELFQEIVHSYHIVTSAARSAENVILPYQGIFLTKTHSILRKTDSIVRT